MARRQGLEARGPPREERGRARVRAQVGHLAEIAAAGQAARRRGRAHRPSLPVTSRSQAGWWNLAQARVTVPRIMASMEPLVQMAA